MCPTSRPFSVFFPISNQKLEPFLHPNLLHDDVEGQSRRLTAREVTHTPTEIHATGEFCWVTSQVLANRHPPQPDTNFLGLGLCTVVPIPSLVVYWVLPGPLVWGDPELSWPHMASDAHGCSASAQLGKTQMQTVSSPNTHTQLAFVSRNSQYCFLDFGCL